MEETLTNCLVRVREDLSQLQKVRDYLEIKAGTEEHCSVTWRTIEAFTSILSVCSSQNTPETDALDTLLDSFYYLVRNNTDNSVWNDFGFELGIICVKVLSAIERTEIFELLFCKLLSVISIISEHNSNVWKAAARQILNALINKKFCLSNLETILKQYICIIRNIESIVLNDFSSQNLHLLKTLSLLVQKVGDFEIQSDIMQLIFLHLSRDTKLMSGFFAPSEKKLFQSLKFADFEWDCRLYLNAINKERRGFEKKVYSICCHVLYLGGCFVEPPVGRNSIWVDANKDSERLTINCGDYETNGNRVFQIQFSNILHAQLENDKTEGNRCLTIQTKSLLELHNDVKNDDICLVAENEEGVHEFVHFLEAEINERKRKKRFGRKISKTMDSLFIDRNSPREKVQDNAVTSSERTGIDQILPDVLSFFEKENHSEKDTNEGLKYCKTKTPPRTQSQEKKVSQELSPNSFVESLNKHIGLNSPDLRHTYEDSIETIEFLQKTANTPGETHTLFGSPERIFNISQSKESNGFSFMFEENKENEPPLEICKKTKIKTYSRKDRPSKPTDNPPNTRVLRDRKNLETKLSNSQSQDFFQKSSDKKKKPTLPKLKRSRKVGEGSKQGKIQNGHKGSESKITAKLDKKQKESSETTKPEMINAEEKRKLDSSGKQAKTELKKKKSEPKQDPKPSLLDPNSYAYQRWCKPTTSERSNFWLKKLKAMQKPKKDSDIFDFSDETDSICEKNKKKKRKIVHSKRKCTIKKETKQTSLREVKEILKKTSPVPEKPASISPKTQNPQMEPETRSPVSPHNSEASIQSSGLTNPPHSDSPVPDPKLEIFPEEPLGDDSEYESILSSEDEEPRLQTKKRDRSDESSKGGAKKKHKTTFPRSLLSSLRRRLEKAEEKNKRYTDEIIQTVNKATNHLFNQIQRKDGERVVSYLTTAEEVSKSIDAEVEDLNVRAKRIQRAILYFKSGCSVSDFVDNLESHFSNVRLGLNNLKEKRDSLKTIDRINDRLKSLIKSEIEKSIKNEWELKRDKLLSCASILGPNFREFS